MISQAICNGGGGDGGEWKKDAPLPGRLRLAIRPAITFRDLGVFA